jgi:hypothetical protein
LILIIKGKNMKNHTHVIKLIVITAALVALGVIAFKYMHTRNDAIIDIQRNVQINEDDASL